MCKGEKLRSSVSGVSALAAGERSAASRGHFTPDERAPITQAGDLMGPRAGLVSD
jgi:hypothetical protein